MLKRIFFYFGIVLMLIIGCSSTAQAEEFERVIISVEQKNSEESIQPRNMISFEQRLVYSGRTIPVSSYEVTVTRNGVQYTGTMYLVYYEYVSRKDQTEAYYQGLLGTLN